MVLVLAMGIIGCSKPATTGASSAGRQAYTSAHELRFSMAADIAGLNPLINGTGYEMALAQLTMAYLIRTDARGEPTVPELITEIPTQKNGGISADGKTIVWHLRRGVVWSDGVPFTADDVVFSARAVLNPLNNVVSRDGWELIEKIEKLDKYAVAFRLRKPYGAYAVTFFSTAGANPAVMPEHLLGKYENLNRAPYNALPVGVGPFKYQSWKRGESVTMIANPRYFRGRPKLDRIVFKIIPDRNTVLEQLRSHEIDLWPSVPPHFVPEVKKIPGVTVSRSRSFYFDHLDFNLAHPALADPAVRLALRYATDRKEINNKIRFGLYQLSESVVPPASKFYDAAISLVPFDIGRANALLDRAAWARGSDGVRSKNGVRLSLDFVSASGSPDTDQEIEMIRGWWKRIGVEITVKHYPAPLMFAPIQDGGIVYTGKFDVIAFAWGTDPNQDLANLYSCERFPPNGQNDVRYCNRAVTAAIEKAQGMYDRTARRALMNVIQEQIFSDAPTIVLDVRRDIQAYSDDLKGWSPNSLAPFDDMMRVDI
jgi:peptide/nickel transport system substrate-binding protein